jgi:hypothetical protein
LVSAQSTSHAGASLSLINHPQFVPRVAFVGLLRVSVNVSPSLSTVPSSMVLTVTVVELLPAGIVAVPQV